MASLEVTKFVEFAKGYIIDRPNMFLEGSIKVEGLQMGAQVHWRKALANIFQMEIWVV